MSDVTDRLDKADEALTNLSDDYTGDLPEAFEGAVESARQSINVARALASIRSERRDGDV